MIYGYIVAANLISVRYISSDIFSIPLYWTHWMIWRQ